MVRLSILGALVSALLTSCTLLCNDTLPSNVLHKIKRRNAHGPTSNEYEYANVQSDFPLYADDSTKRAPEIGKLELKVRPLITVLSKQDDMNNSPNIYQEKIDNGQVELPWILGNYTPEESDRYEGFSIITLLKDLYDCIELNRIKASKLCTDKEKRNDGTENLYSDHILRDDELEIKIRHTCEKINNIIRSSFEEVKRKYVKSIKYPLYETNDEMTGVLLNAINNNTEIERVRAVNVTQVNQPSTTEFSTSDIYIDDIFNKTTENYENSDEEFKYSTTVTTTTKDSPIEADRSGRDGSDDVLLMYDTTNPNVQDIEDDKSTDESNDVLNTIAMVDDNNGAINRNEAILQEDTTPLYEPLSTTHSENMYMLYNLDNTGIEVENTNDVGNSDILNETNTIDDASQLAIDKETKLINKIITREFSNDTVISVIDGTETNTNSDFSMEQNYIENDEIKNNVANISEFSIAAFESSPVESHYSKRNVSLVKSLIGHLYLVHDTQKIPAHFIQDADGKLKVGIDILSLCRKESEENKVSLIKAMCDCMNVDRNDKK